LLEASREQSEEMKAAISAWKVIYWAPHLAQIEAEKRAAKINREFASHFRPSALLRLLMLFRRRDNPSPFIGDRPVEVLRKAVQEANSSGEVAKRDLIHG
jgi:hypothetical protein